MQTLTPCRVPVASFHLTIAVLKLFEEEDIQRAKALLVTAAERARGILALLPADAQPPRIHAKGLAVMQPNPSKVRKARGLLTVSPARVAPVTRRS